MIDRRVYHTKNSITQKEYFLVYYENIFKICFLTLDKIVPFSMKNRRQKSINIV